MINSDYELGYTPSNLKKLMTDNSLTNIQVAEIIGKSVKAVERYRSNIDKASHITMEHSDWLSLIKLIENSKTGSNDMKAGNDILNFNGIEYCILAVRDANFGTDAPIHYLLLLIYKVNGVMIDTPFFLPFAENSKAVPEANPENKIGRFWANLASVMPDGFDDVGFVQHALNSINSADIATLDQSDDKDLSKKMYAVAGEYLNLNDYGMVFHDNYSILFNINFVSAFKGVGVIADVLKMNENMEKLSHNN